MKWNTGVVYALHTVIFTFFLGQSMIRFYVYVHGVFYVRTKFDIYLHFHYAQTSKILIFRTS